MSSKVVVISEWLPESNQDETVFQLFKELARNTLGNEKGCLKYHVMRQVSHPCATGESKFSIVLIQEYTNTQAFDEHCELKRGRAI